MKYELVLTGKFKRGLKIAKKRGLDTTLLEDIVERLLRQIPMDVLSLILIDTGTHADLFDG